MLTAKKMQESIGLILLIGTLFSACLVLIGGVMYLAQSGTDNMRLEILQASSFKMSFAHMLASAMTFSSVGIIELGLLSLVATQTIRVALLCWFYVVTRDYIFTAISIFILIMLIYSTFWRHG